jgi:hypothetical protein
MNGKRFGLGALCCLLLAAAACSGGSDGSGSSDPGSADGQGSESAPVSSTEPEFQESDCPDAIAAFTAIVASVEDVPAELDASQQEALQDQLSKLQARVPSELDGAVTAISNAFQVFVATTADLDPSDAGAIESAAEPLRSDEVGQARADIDAFFADRCEGSTPD